jgi:hypothetical protein
LEDRRNYNETLRDLDGLAIGRVGDVDIDCDDSNRVG